MGIECEPPLCTFRSHWKDVQDVSSQDVRSRWWDDCIDPRHQYILGPVSSATLKYVWLFVRLPLSNALQIPRSSVELDLRLFRFITAVGEASSSAASGDFLIRVAAHLSFVRMSVNELVTSLVFHRVTL